MSKIARRVVCCVAGVAVVAVGGGAQVRAQAADPYSGSGSAALVDVDGSLGAQSIADLRLVPSDVTVSTGSTPRSSARSANLDALVLGTIDLSGILSEASQSALPDHTEPTNLTLLPVPAAPIVAADVSTATVHARWAGDGRCPTRGEPISAARTSVALVDLLDVTGSGPAIRLTNDAGGFSSTSTETRLVDGPSGAGALRTVAQAQTLHVELFHGTAAEITIDLVGTFEVSATATGVPGTAATSVTWPLVTVTLPGGQVIGPVTADQLQPVVQPIGTGLDALLGLGTFGSVTISAGQSAASANADGRAASIDGAALRVSLELAPAGVPLIDTDLALSPLSATASVPAGGIACPTTPPVESSPTTIGSAVLPRVDATNATLAATGTGTAALMGLGLLLLVAGALGLFVERELVAGRRPVAIGTARSRTTADRSG